MISAVLKPRKSQQFQSVTVEQSYHGQIGRETTAIDLTGQRWPVRSIGAERAECFQESLYADGTPLLKPPLQDPWVGKLGATSAQVHLAAFCPAPNRARSFRYVEIARKPRPRDVLRVADCLDLIGLERFRVGKIPAVFQQ